MFKFLKKTGLTLLLCLLFVTLAACGGSEREPLNSEDYFIIMSDKGYTMNEVTGQFEDGLVDLVCLAYNDDYQIEFFVLPTVEQTRSAFQVNVSDFENDRGSSHTSSNKEMGNYGYFKQTSNSQFYVVAYIDNTMIYAVVPQDFKDEVNDVIEELGYLSKTVTRE